METTLFERVIDSLTKHKVLEVSPNLSDFLETLRKERYALTLLVEILSERIGFLLESEQQLKNNVLKELMEHVVSEKVSGDFLFRLERTPDKVVYKEKVTSLYNTVSPQAVSLFPKEFIEKKEVFVLKRKAFEKAIIKGMISPIASHIEGKSFVKVSAKNPSEVSEESKHAMELMGCL